MRRIEVPSLAAIRSALAADGARAKKSYGQHFLTDPGLLERIVDVAELAADDVVLEVGPGPGVLTATLLNRGVQVVAVEADPGMIGVLRQLLGEPERLTVIANDVLAERPAPGSAIRAALGTKGSPRPYSLVANLPYQIASPLLVDVFESAPPRVAVVMVQREVSQRLRAPPGSDAYGLLSVLIGLHARVEEVLRLKPGAFWPAPKVESSVVRLRPRGDDAFASRIAALPPGRLTATLRRTFQERRKTLANNLLRDSEATREVLEKALRRGGFAPDSRAEVVPVDDFVRLAEILHELEPGAGETSSKQKQED